MGFFLYSSIPRGDGASSETPQELAGLEVINPGQCCLRETSQKLKVSPLALWGVTCSRSRTLRENGIYSVLLWAETACAEIPSAVRDPKPCRYCSGVQETHGRRAPREDCPHFYCFLLHCDYSLIWFPMCTLCCLSHDFRSQHSFWSNSDLQIHSSHACIQKVPCVQPHGPNSHLE